MKKLLIISPYFPPTNAADMQRVRMSLSYYRAFGWDVEVVMVDEQYSELLKDELLLESIPPDVTIYKVKALNTKWTSKLGLGSLALRSIPYFFKTVNAVLKKNKFDLIYFSTTQFPVCILGAYWKKKFKVPFVIDMQDPWHSNYYQNKPKEQRPKKYWFSYNLNKYLEPVALKNADGLISVSDSYITDLKERYPVIKNIPAATITFGAFQSDLEIAEKNKDKFKSLLYPGFKNIVYIGRGGMDMHKAIEPVFKSLSICLKNQPELFSKLKFYFIGTSYASAGNGTPSITPLAKKHGIEDNVIEITDRISYYHTLNTIQLADALFVPGSDDPKYSASKIYPYLLSSKPLLTIFNSNSPIINILAEFGSKHSYSYDKTEALTDKIAEFLKKVVYEDNEFPIYNESAKQKYSAKNITEQQCILFNEVLNGKS